MAKDYFQDIVPPQGKARTIPVRSATPPAPLHPETHEDIPDAPERALGDTQPSSPERSIRNISAPRPRPRPTMDVRGIEGGMPPSRRRSRFWLWGIAMVLLIALGGLLLLALRPTSVTVTPRTHALVLDETHVFTALPAESAASGTLLYTVTEVEFADSEVVTSEGTVHAEEKASGVITIYNSYSDAPVRLIKNTRFESPGGLIFRAPADIVVPGKKSDVPGKVNVTVVADQPGESYNVAAGRFTLPGLKSSGDMYARVYGESASPMTGGFSGERPGVAAGDRDTAIAALRARLSQKVNESATAVTGESIAFPNLAQVTFESGAPTTEAGGAVRIHEKARVRMPVFSAESFASALADAVSADAGAASVHLAGIGGLTPRLLSATSTLGADPIQFSVTGSATLVWNVDSAALASALAGREQGAFQTIIAGFEGIEEAHARIEPFWSTNFPKDPSDIKIRVEVPSE